MKLLYPTSREISGITDLIEPQAEGTLRATMVIGRNGATSVDGHSKLLSNPEDRRMYHLLRDQCDAIVVGKNSHHLYDKVSKPVFVLSRDVNLREQLERLFDQGFRRLLCEGGATVLSALLQDDLIDELYLTMAPINGDDDSTRIAGGKLGLGHLATDSGYLFTHYVRNHSPDVGRGSS